MALIQVTENENILVMVCITSSRTAFPPILTTSSRPATLLMCKARLCASITCPSAMQTMPCGSEKAGSRRKRETAGVRRDYLGNEDTILTCRRIIRASRSQIISGTVCLRPPPDVLHDCAAWPETAGQRSLWPCWLASGFAVPHTGQQDIRVGVPVANRIGVETTGLIVFS